MKRHGLLIKAILFGVLIFIVILGIGYTANHEYNKTMKHEAYLTNHLSSISTNNTVLGNKHISGHYTMVFYRHDCPHCQRVVPHVYEHNQWTFQHHVQYRDLAGHSNNYTLATRLDLPMIPAKESVNVSHGKIISHKYIPKIE